jgi:hypothetical protein
MLFHMTEVISSIGVVARSQTLQLEFRWCNDNASEKKTLKYLETHFFASGASSNHCSYSGIVKKSRLCFPFVT